MRRPWQCSAGLEGVCLHADRGRFWPIGVPMLFLSPISGGPELTIPSKLNPRFNSYSQAYVFSRTGTLRLESDQQA